MAERARQVFEGAPAWAKGEADRDFFGDYSQCSVKDLVVMLEHPFFLLSKKKIGEKVNYVYKDAKIEIIPSKLGAATIYDKGILVFLASQYFAARSHRQNVSAVVTVKASTLLHFLGRSNGGTNYDELIAALDRLAGTRIKTNLATGDVMIKENFGWIDGYKIVGRTSTGKMMTVQITLSRWIHNALVAREVLTLDPRYFELSPLRRRIYEIVRKHCGNQPEFCINLSTLFAKCGSQGQMKKFRMIVRDLCAEPDHPANGIPGYHIHYNEEKDQVVARPRRHVRIQSSVE